MIPASYFGWTQTGQSVCRQTHLPATVWSCGWAAAVFLCERRSDPPGLELGRLDIGTSLLKGHTLSRHYHSLQSKRERNIRIVTKCNGEPCICALFQPLGCGANS